MLRENVAAQTSNSKANLDARNVTTNDQSADSPSKIHDEKVSGTLPSQTCASILTSFSRIAFRMRRDRWGPHLGVHGPRRLFSPDYSLGLMKIFSAVGASTESDLGGFDEVRGFCQASGAVQHDLELAVADIGGNEGFSCDFAWCVPSFQRCDLNGLPHYLTRCYCD